MAPFTFDPTLALRPTAMPLQLAPARDGLQTMAANMPLVAGRGPAMTSAAPVLVPVAQESSPRQAAGWIVLAAGAGAAVGAVLGGGWGAASGLLLAGAGANAWRAQRDWGSPDEAARGEAAKSATLTVFGIGIGGWLGYKAHQARTGRDEKDDD